MQPIIFDYDIHVVVLSSKDGNMFQMRSILVLNRRLILRAGSAVTRGRPPKSGGDKLMANIG